MEPRITFAAIEVFSDGEDHEGCLALANGRLVAVLVRLTDPVYGPALVGSWYLEMGFGAELEMRHDLFANLGEAEEALAAALTGAFSLPPAPRR